MKLFIVFALVAVAFAADSDRDATVKSSESNVDPDGSYQFRYETSNGIAAQEAGVGGISAQGEAQWYAPDGTPVQFSYVADENGYRADGPFIPVGPPAPEWIARQQEWIRSHPPKETRRN